jgi:hypothetical protein
VPSSEGAPATPVGPQSLSLESTCPIISRRCAAFGDHLISIRLTRATGIPRYCRRIVSSDRCTCRSPQTASLVVSNGQRQFVQKEGVAYTVRYGPSLQSIVSELIIRLFFTHVPGLRLGLVGWRHGDMWRAAFAWVFFPIGPSLQNVTSIRFSVWCFQSAYVVIYRARSC